MSERERDPFTEVLATRLGEVATLLRLAADDYDAIVRDLDDLTLPELIRRVRSVCDESARAINTLMESP